MMDRAFDNYVMNHLQQVRVRLHRGPREPWTRRCSTTASSSCCAPTAGSRTWLGENALPPHVSLVTCAAAPSLFYADWVERIPEDCPRLATLRAELLRCRRSSRCVEDARPFRAYFPLGAPDRD